MRYKNMILSMIILNIINIIYNVAGQESCPIVDGSHLPCILINNCPSLMTILKAARPIPESNLNILRSHHCGFDEETLKIPKVCCPSTIRFEASSEIPYETEMLNGTTPSSLKSKDHPNLKLLNHDICGPITEAKIYGGNITSVIEFPWMALLAYDVQDRVEFRCSGTIINKRYILTAAHCVTNLALGIRLKGVRVGEHDINTERDCDRDSAGFEIICVERHQDFNIESYQFHFDYKKGALHNDIGLIRVDSDIDFRPINVKPICLPIGIAAVLNHQKLTVTGWGATETHRLNSLKLRMVILTQVSDEECAEIYKRSKPIWYKQICAGGQSGKDSCLGDSGGPLQAPALYNNNPRFVQYGIVSYGAKNCGTRGYPGVYTRVSYYVDWILDHMTD